MQETPPIPLRAPRAGLRESATAPRAAKPKLKKLRLTLILLGLGALALISTVFGMMMAVAHELPQLEAHAQLRAAKPSVMFATGGQQIGHITGEQNRIILDQGQISPNIENAVIAIEDKRFYEHRGVDFRGIARAFFQDVLHQHAQQGASTITQQFVKNALVAQKKRTLFEKLREAALAYHLERRWSKQKILTQYLNTIYFGNGAYGVESAMRTYFGGRNTHYTPNERLAENATPDQAALLAGIIANPTAYDPVQNPVNARKRRDLVLADMLQQGMITRQEYNQAVLQTVPSAQDIATPHPDSNQPYFSTWVTQQLVDRYGSGKVFGGGLKVTTSIDPAMQQAAQNAIAQNLWYGGPSSSIVVIDNKTGEVKAMVGGSNFERKPFNLATNGHRQPGSAFKPFTLATALTHGVSPYSVWSSHKKVFPVPHTHGHERFVVNNFDNEYSGSTTLANATAHSDNSVFAELGLKLGTRKIARMAEKMGIRTPVSTNPAMTLGGLKEGVTPLEMAYAYSTIANYGKRVSGTFAASKMGPVAIEKVDDGGQSDKNERRTERVYSWQVGEEMRSLLRGVVMDGTGTHAQVDEWSAGKTGTTENYGDAWFVGFTDRYTAAVWVGYPDKLRFMRTEYRGRPVEGGTYPADIWHDLMQSIIGIDRARHPNQKDNGQSGEGPNGGITPVPTGPSTEGTGPNAPSQTPQAPSTGGGGHGGAGGGGGKTPQRAPQEPPAPQPAQPPQQPPPPDGGGTGGQGGGAGIPPPTG
jgi:penicillin-binding protein 1A